MRLRFFIGCLSLIYLLFPAKACSLIAQEQQPNIVFILADDLGWADVGFNGSLFYETPHLDRLASQGVFFSNAYSNAPICAPSRAAILSGQYAPRTGFYTNHSPERGKASWRAVHPPPNHHGLDLEKITLAEVLRAHGYRTFLGGKWHLGDSAELYPEEQGFEVNKGGFKSGRPPTYFSPYQNPRLKDGPPGEYLTDRLASEAITFMEVSGEDPFFVYLSFYSPHTPLMAKDSLVRKYYPKAHHNGQFDPVYAAMIESLDQNVGRVLSHLEERGKAGNTIVVFFSDNGVTPFVAPDGPLRGYKGTLYEGGIRVPLILSLPGGMQGKVMDTPVMGIDLYPTLLDLAGIDPPEDYKLDGQSLRPLLTGEGGFRDRSLFWHFPAYLQGEYGMKELWRTRPVSVVRKGNCKLIENLEDGSLELYDLEKDPGETINLAEAENEMATDLFSLLQDWRKQMGVSYPLEANEAYDASSIPDHSDNGHRSDIYRLKKPKRK